jgi:radical SAM superfamily enzyme YgiQ (UPF0313 family)
MTSILLTTLNSSYQHAAFGLRYLRANLGELRDQSRIFEFTTDRTARDVAEVLISQNPKIIGLSVYIWNAKQTLDLVSLLKKLAPDVILVLGGPEISFETEKQELFQWVDYVVGGEGDFIFRELCLKLLAGEKPAEKILRGALPDIASIQMPYAEYNDEDIKNRVIYVEASRGCPYKCEYCLSSLDKSVRNFSLEKFLTEMQTLLDRGVRQFKFIDRTFNLSPSISTQILQFFLKNIQLGLFLHFEMVPDRLPDELKELIVQFPAGSLQFEIGVQTLNPQVAALVSRRNDYQKMKDNLRFLREKTSVHTHVDLIAGLPGEDLASFAKGFDELVELEPDEVQVGVLKRLRGTPIIRHDQTWQMIYQEQSPYQVIGTKMVSFLELQQINRFSKHWDQIANSGQFIETTKFLRQQAQFSQTSFFGLFAELSQFLTQKFPTSQNVGLVNLFQSVFQFLTLAKNHSETEIKDLLAKDYARSGRHDLPSFLKSESSVSTKTQMFPATPKRQRLHLSQESPKLTT